MSDDGGKTYYRYVGGRITFDTKAQTQEFVDSHSAEFHNLYATA